MIWGRKKRFLSTPLRRTQSWKSEEPPRRKSRSLLFTKERESTSGHTEPEALEDSQASTSWSTLVFQFNSNDIPKAGKELHEAYIISVVRSPRVSSSHHVLWPGFHRVRPRQPCLTGSPSQWLHTLCIVYTLISVAGVLQIIYKLLTSKEGYCLIPQLV